MSGDESTIFSTYFLIAIIIFGTLGLLLIVFHEGIFDSGLDLFNSNASIQNTSSSSTERVAERILSCTLNAAHWEKNGNEVTSVALEDDVEIVVEGTGCDEKRLIVIVYIQNASSNTVVESFSQVSFRNGTAVVSWDSELEGSYYFGAELITNSSVSIESKFLEVTSSLLIRDPLLCNGFGDDRDYLYDVDITVSTKQNGLKTFIASLNGTTLRVNTEEDQFFYDNSKGVLEISYDLAPSCGGLDIVYHITNPSSQPQLLPDFLFGGFRQEKTNPRYLELRRGGFLTSTGGASSLYADYYPSSFVYSPITTIVSDSLAQGSSINYPFMEYNVEVIPQLSWSSEGKVAYRHSLVHPSSSGPVLATIAAGKTQIYTISVRFSPSRNWLLTLDPYKKYFDQLYGPIKRTSKDMRPVGGVSEAFTEYVNDTNLRGYNYWFVPGKRIDIDGWGAEVTRLIEDLTSKNYERLMIWQTAGMYDPRVCDCNFPAQYMDWLPKLIETQGELQRIRNAGISLGFWWGRSGQVVAPNTWPPASISNIISANYSNDEHHTYLIDQFNLGKQRGADMIGLDSFGFMEPYGRSKWLDEMISSSSLEFVHEHGGADLFHARAANFYTDEYENGQWETISGPSVLSWYLNPNSEIWAYEVASPSEFQSLGQAGMKARAEKLARWGYTYIDAGLFLDVSSLDLSVSECLDGKDNDGDNVVDWPRDDDCSDEFDESE